jgi:hypothetical protein
VKKMVKVDGSDVDKTDVIKVDFLMDPDNPASNNFPHFTFFKEGYPKEWIKYL